MKTDSVHLAAPGSSTLSEAAPLAIDTGDHVLHRPSGETWVVAYVREGRLSACGWPDEVVPAADCELVKKADAEQRQEWLEALASNGGHRGDYARRVLAQSGHGAQAEGHLRQEARSDEGDQ